MALSVGETVRLGLRLRAARFVDPQCARSGNEAFEKLAEYLFDLVTAAALRVKDDWPIEATNTLLGRVISEITVDEDSSVARQLKDSLIELQRGSGGIGEGIAFQKTTPQPDGILELADLIATHTKMIIERAGVNLDGGPDIKFVTALFAGDPDPQREPLSGQSTARERSRKVTIFFPDERLDGRSLIRVAYVLFHELICHAFQAWHADAPENAGKGCSWSEGWMDAVAFEAALAWILIAPAEWIPLRGETAIDTIREAHGERYHAVKMSASDLRRRREARDAFKRLPELILKNNLAADMQDACALSERFSYVLNTHRAGGPKMYRRLAELLVNFILGDDPENNRAAALACISFVDHRNIQLLEGELVAGGG